MFTCDQSELKRSSEVEVQFLDGATRRHRGHVRLAASWSAMAAPTAVDHAADRRRRPRRLLTPWCSTFSPQ